MRAALLWTCFVLCGCSSAGGWPCTTSADCPGDGWVCRYELPSSDHPPCMDTHGTCTRVTCTTPNCANDLCPPWGAWEFSELNACRCDGTVVTYPARCPQAPIYAIGTGNICGCEATRDAQALHPGPRGPTEWCEGSVPRSIDNGFVWTAPHCCDCSLALSGSQYCQTDAFTLLPSGCCHCFDRFSPDPSGACAPPGGWTATGPFQWCCPISAPAGDGGARADAG